MCISPLHNKCIGMSRAWLSFHVLYIIVLCQLFESESKFRNYRHENVLGNCANEFGSIFTNTVNTLRGMKNPFEISNVQVNGWPPFNVTKLYFTQFAEAEQKLSHVCWAKKVVTSIYKVVGQMFLKIILK